MTTKLATMAREVNRQLDTSLYDQEALLLHQSVDEETFDKIAAVEEELQNTEEIKANHIPSITILKMAEQIVLEEKLAENPELVKSASAAAALGRDAAEEVIRRNSGA